MRRAAVLLLVACLVAEAAPAGARAPWKRRIDRLTAGAPVGVAVAHRGDLLYRRRARARRIPASNQKLVLSMAALDVLGAGRRLPTTARARRVRAGVVRGDLWVAGRGDPTIASSPRYARSLRIGPTWVGRLARRLRARGVRALRGSVVGGLGYFRRDWAAPGWRPDFPRRWIPLPSALSLDGNVHRGRHVADPERRFARALTRRLESFGVRVRGRPRAGRIPAGTRALARVRSRPLRALLRPLNRRSSNFFAEVLGKRLAVARFGRPGTIARGALALERWARRRGVRVVAHDSSGLSYANRVSPLGLVRLLASARREPWGRALRRSLPRGGRGTLEDRLPGVPLRAKTGTLQGVSALSGWVWQRARRRWLEFSIMVRGLDKERAAALEDRVVRTLAASGRRAGTPGRA